MPRGAYLIIYNKYARSGVRRQKLNMKLLENENGGIDLKYCLALVILKSLSLSVFLTIFKISSAVG